MAHSARNHQGPKDHSPLAWKELHRSPMHKGPLFTLYRSRQESHDGRQGDFTLLECPDWVNVVALDTRKDRPEALMVRQYRFGGAVVSLEFPGGVVDPGETHGQAARRELREECGCTARTWIHLGSINPNPSFMTNTTHSWLALDLDVDANAMDLDEFEILTVERIGLDELMAGQVRDFERNGVMLCTWYWLRQWLDLHGSTIIKS